MKYRIVHLHFDVEPQPSNHDVCLMGIFYDLKLRLRVVVGIEFAFCIVAYLEIGASASALLNNSFVLQHVGLITST